MLLLSKYLKQLEGDAFAMRWALKSLFPSHKLDWCLSTTSTITQLGESNTRRVFTAFRMIF
jgi:hypothetical protein